MRAPEFWSGRASGRDIAPLLQALLTPASWAYALAAAQRARRIVPRHAPVPVICVGNFTVGGAGKTPVARALREKLGPHAHLLSRGYGGKLEGPLRVTPDMRAHEVGDEPLLHAADGPAWISRDRVAGALAAAQAGAHVIVMDDGFQNPALGKDLSLVVVDAGYGVGNARVFPAGPLREALADGLKRADAIVLLGAPDPEARWDWLADFDKPVLAASLDAVGAPPDGPLVAFAGIARPEKFFDTLSGLGANLTDTVPFADHHEFTDADLEWLAKTARERGAGLITTEKDCARLAPEWRAQVAVLPVRVRFDDDATLEAVLAPVRARMPG